MEAHLGVQPMMLAQWAMMAYTQGIEPCTVGFGAQLACLGTLVYIGWIRRPASGWREQLYVLLQVFELLRRYSTVYRS